VFALQVSDCVGGFALPTHLPTKPIRKGEVGASCQTRCGDAPISPLHPRYEFVHTLERFWDWFFWDFSTRRSSGLPFLLLLHTLLAFDGWRSLFSFLAPFFYPILLVQLEKFFFRRIIPFLSRAIRSFSRPALFSNHVFARFIIMASRSRVSLFFFFGFCYF
jgi:hypothetical protein